MIIGDARWVSWPGRTPPAGGRKLEVPKHEAGDNSVTPPAGGVTDTRTADRVDGTLSPGLVTPRENRTRDDDPPD